MQLLPRADRPTIPTDRQHGPGAIGRWSSCDPGAADLLRRGFSHLSAGKEMHLYRLVVKLLEEGPGFLRDLSDETLYPVLRAVRHLNGEAHLLKGFVRFSDLGGVLGGEIAPKEPGAALCCASHFCARYRNEASSSTTEPTRSCPFLQCRPFRLRPLEALSDGPAG